MSDDTTTPEVEPDADAPPAEEAPAAEATKSIPRESFRHPLSRDTDHAARPGFRSPANQGSKAMKRPKRK